MKIQVFQQNFSCNSKFQKCIFTFLSLIKYTTYFIYYTNYNAQVIWMGLVYHLIIIDFQLLLLISNK